jgi:hypothetical protein
MKLLALLLVLLVLIAAPARPVQAWEIRRFEVDLAIQPDARLHVVEALQVDFGPERRHTICRALPRFVTDPSGERRPLQLDLLAVTDAAGRPWPIRVTRSSRTVEIWMGSEERFTTGEQTYRLTYDVSGAVWAGPNRDELHWDATGNAWDVLVIGGAVQVGLPPGADADLVEAASRVTRFGRVMRESDVKIVDAGHARFLMNRGLLTFEGLAVTVVWPQGLVRHPGSLSRAGSFFLRNPALVGVPAVAALLIALGARRRRADRRAPPGAGAPIISAAAITPAAAGFLVAGRLEPAHGAATLFDLAARGEITLDWPGGQEASVGALFRRAKGAAGAAPKPHEAVLLALLFPDGVTCPLAALASRMRPAWPALENQVESALVAGGYLDPRPTSRRSPLGLAALVVLALGVIAGVAGRRAAHGLLGMAIASDWVQVGAASVLLAATAFALGAALPRRTRSGGHLVAWLASVPAAGATEQLPLAIALGREDQWIAGRQVSGDVRAAAGVESGGSSPLAPRDLAAAIRAVKHALAGF